MRFSRISGIAAIGFATTIVGGNLIMVPAGLPLIGADEAEVNTFFANNGNLVGFVSGLTPAAWAMATLFGAGAVAALWTFERKRGEAWSLVGFGGLIMQNATFAAVIAARLALARTAPHDTTATAGLWALHDALLTLNGTFLAAALVGLSVGGLRAKFIRPWHGGLGLLAATLQFTAACLASAVIEQQSPLGLIGLTGWLLWAVWLVVYGIRLIRTAPTKPAAQLPPSDDRTAATPTTA
jgi:hypothetical protein